MAPLIGITADLANVRWDAWDRPAYVIATPIPQTVARVGGAPIIMAPSSDNVQEFVNRLDGFIISGGLDVDPQHYGHEPHQKTKTAHPDRDKFEIMLARAVLESNKPILGICRGMQVMNVARGGTLIQHLPDVSNDIKHRPNGPRFLEHWITTQPGSRIHTLLGDKALVAAHHHQAVDELGDSGIATAWAEDGTVEGLEFSDHPWALGVQCHPEESGHDEIIADLVAQSAHIPLV